MKEVMEGKMVGKRGPGRKRLGRPMIDDLFEREQQYGDLKRRVKNQQEWRIWLPATSRMAEH